MRNTYLKNLYTLDKYKKILLATLVAFPVWEGNILWAADEYETLRTAIETSAPQAVRQQKKTVTGLLTDVDGNPIIGATIIIKGTTTGVTTDINGRYTLKGVKVGDVIEFRFIGFNTEEQRYKGEPVINIRMMEASVGLGDVGLSVMVSRRKKVWYLLSTLFPPANYNYRDVICQTTSQVRLPVYWLYSVPVNRVKTIPVSGFVV